jgi:hypothetical protein
MQRRIDCEEMIRRRRAIQEMITRATKRAPVKG